MKEPEQISWKKLKKRYILYHWNVMLYQNMSNALYQMLHFKDSCNFVFMMQFL